MDIDAILNPTVPSDLQRRRQHLLAEAFAKYAKVLVSDRVVDEDGELVIELAYDDITRVVNDLVDDEKPGYDRALHFINVAYDLAVDPHRAIVEAVQMASMQAINEL